TDADLKPFQARGGKLILYHGWNDPAIPALNTVNYYQSVLAKMGGDADSFGQVGQLTFEDPQHSVDAALERWVEKGEAPGTIIASKYSADDRQHPKMTRPLCAYPQAAKYKGKSDANDAASFVCEGKK